jgi:hypothetical protein
MSTLRIPLDREAAEQSGTLTLDGEQYRLRVRWQEASLGWYADLFTLDGQVVQAGRRLSPGWSPFLGLRGPPGAWVVFGLDDAGQLALSTDALQLAYVEART